MDIQGIGEGVGRGGGGGGEREGQSEGEVGRRGGGKVRGRGRELRTQIIHIIDIIRSTNIADVYVYRDAYIYIYI